MANTSVRVKMDILADAYMYAPGIAKITATNASTFSVLPVIAFGYNRKYEDFITLEHNINILDGSLSHFKDNFTTGYFSTNLSDDNCISNNIINIDFSSSAFAPYDIPGLTLYFGNNNYMDEVIISYTDINNNIQSKTFYPNREDFKAIFSGYKINKIKIGLQNTRFPRMFTRLNHINYGFSYIWEGADVISCNIVEEISPISNVFPINTADVTIYSEENEWNVLNKQGIYSFLNKGHAIKIEGIYNNETIQMGTFYIDTYEGSKPYEISFHLINIIGILEQYQYTSKGIQSYNVGELITNSVLKEAKENFSFEILISDEIKNKQLNNVYLESGSVRSVLQRILFSVNAYADATRDGNLKISRANKIIQSSLYASDVIDTVNISKTEQVTGIYITTYDYYPPYKIDENSVKWETIYTGKIPSEGKIFNLNKPAFQGRFQVIGSTNWNSITTLSSDNLAFELFDYFDENDDYIVQVCYYEEYKSTYKTTYKDNEEDTTSTNIIKVENNKLINSNNVEEFANMLIDYYKYNQLKVEAEYLFDGTIKTASASSIYTDYKNYCQGFIVKQSIDLSGGFISKCTMLGTNINVNYYPYMTNGNDKLVNTGQYDLIMNDNLQL